MSTIVKTQGELDAAVAAGAEYIVIASPAGVWLDVHDSATVTASGSATVTASAHVAVHIHSAHVVATGGVIIDVSGLDLSDAVSWCAHHGVDVVAGVATVFKAVDGSWTTGRGTDYSPGSLPEAPDWRDDHECGGGLHFSPWPWQALEYHPEATRFVAVGVAIETIRPIWGGVPKCKAPRVVVACREVTINGDEVTA